MTPTRNLRRGAAVVAGLALAALALGACGGFTVETPKGMVSIEKRRTKLYYKAYAPDGSVATVSAFEHRDKGTLEFWTEVVKREMARRKGYKLLESGEIKTTSGLTGQQLSYAVQNGSTKYRYSMALFVTSSYLYAVEAAARQKDFERHKGAFDSLVASFRPR